MKIAVATNSLAIRINVSKSDFHMPFYSQAGYVEEALHAVLALQGFLNQYPTIIGL